MQRAILSAVLYCIQIFGASDNFTIVHLKDNNSRPIFHIHVHVAMFGQSILVAAVASIPPGLVVVVWVSVRSTFVTAIPAGIDWVEVKRAVVSPSFVSRSRCRCNTGTVDSYFVRSFLDHSGVAFILVLNMVRKGIFFKNIILVE